MGPPGAEGWGGDCVLAQLQAGHGLCKHSKCLLCARRGGRGVLELPAQKPRQPAVGCGVGPFEGVESFDLSPPLHLRLLESSGRGGVGQSELPSP